MKYYETSLQKYETTTNIFEKLLQIHIIYNVIHYKILNFAVILHKWNSL